MPAWGLADYMPFPRAAGHGTIVAGYFDVGQSRTLA
jgi:hypothetical protein